MSSSESFKNELQRFNDFYKKEARHSFESSLMDFFQQVVSPRLSAETNHILELGSGAYSLFEKTNNIQADVLAIDFSSEAITHAPKNSLIKYRNLDVTNKDFLKDFDENYFNLIFDSHCFHCIVDPLKRREAYRNVYRYLSRDGLFCAEMMVQTPGKLSVHEYKFIPRAEEIEREFLANNFIIKYFVVSRDLVFDLNDNKKNECDLLRIVATK